MTASGIFIFKKVIRRTHWRHEEPAESQENTLSSLGHEGKCPPPDKEYLPGNITLNVRKQLSAISRRHMRPLLVLVSTHNRTANVIRPEREIKRQGD